MDLITIFVLAVGLSMDSFAVAISCGLAEQKVKFGHAVKISLAFAFFQGILPLLGWLMGTELKVFMEHIDHWIAFSLLAFLGGKMIYESFGANKEVKSTDIYSFRHILALSVATSIDALVVGFSYAIAESGKIFGGVLIIGAVTFVINGKAYMGCGYNGSTRLKDFWEFENGVIYSINNNGKVLNSTIFGNLDYYNNPDLMSFVNEDYEKEMTTFKLVKYIYDHRNSSPRSLALFWMELYNKLALPMMSLIFVLIGVPLAITPPRVRFNRGFLFSIGVIFSYYILKAIALSFGETCMLPAFLATWTPNLVIGSVGAYMFCKKAFRI